MDYLCAIIKKPCFKFVEYRPFESIAEQSLESSWCAMISSLLHESSGEFLDDNQQVSIKICEPLSDYLVGDSVNCFSKASRKGSDDVRIPADAHAIADAIHKTYRCIEANVGRMSSVVAERAPPIVAPQPLHVIPVSLDSLSYRISISLCFHVHDTKKSRSFGLTVG